LFAEAVNYIVFTKNRNSTSALTNTTPYEVCFNKNLDFIHLVVRLMSTTICPTARSYRLELMKVSSLGMQIHRRPTGYTFRRRGQLFALFMFILIEHNMGNRFWAEGEIHSNTTHSSLPSRNSHLSDLPAQILYHHYFSDDLYSDSAPEHVPNIQNVFQMF